MVHSLIKLVHVVLQECILLFFSSYFYIQIFFFETGYFVTVLLIGK